MESEQFGRAGFAKRLGYARLAYHFRVGDCPSTREIAAAAKKTGEWLAAWAKRDLAPPSYDDYEPIAAFLGVDWRWLFRGVGEPPNPELLALRVAQPPETPEQRDAREARRAAAKLDAEREAQEREQESRDQTRTKQGPTRRASGGK